MLLNSLEISHSRPNDNNKVRRIYAEKKIKIKYKIKFAHATNQVTSHEIEIIFA